MTSRTPMGAQPRPPQRAMSSTSLSVQRPSLQQQQRSLSQQYVPQSPVRKDSLSELSLSGDSPDISQSRHAGTPRRGGSRLRLELSNESASSILPLTTDSPQSLTPSRTAPLSDVMDAGNLSPALSRASHQDLDNPPMPLPRRRPRTSQSVGQSPAPLPAPPSTTTNAARRDARPKPWTVEYPAAAPRYPSSNIKNDKAPASRDPFSRGLNTGYADFYAWTGNHHEDQWSTEAIQKGTWDRNTQTESASARLAIFPALKQKSGLSALSSIFVGVLHQRKVRGQVQAPSTFKPPPRVTLTDTKREVWLRDLANPAISLRRLSRTIPHGIRGRTLLDQCLNKKVPTERAVWLAKCVGANEIRAFKRKGVNGAFVMGGELKWVRDWTVFVEQFIDAVVSAHTEADWKAKVTYAIRLATNLYSEHLLDRDHYLDWVITGLETSNQGRLPMWILIAQIYWDDLLHQRKHGRRLPAALLYHLDTIHNDPDRDILAQLHVRLSSLLTTLIKSNTESFVNPSTWFKYQNSLKANLPLDDAAAHAAFGNADIRNSRLLISSSESFPAAPQQLVKILDSMLQKSTGEDLPQRCWATTEDKHEIVKTLLEWATSIHRPGLAKIYIATRLLKSWPISYYDLTLMILRMLDDVADQHVSRKQLVFHLVAELARSGLFVVPQYIQWLIARGGFSSSADIDPTDGPCTMRLMIELPTYCLPDRLKLERANLLRRAGGYSVKNEEQDIATAVHCVQHSLGFALPADDPVAQRKPIPARKLGRRIRSSSWALKSSVGVELRDMVAKQSSGKDEFAMSLAMFTSIRTIMESTEDFTMFSEILKHCSKATNPEVLAFCADTINANLQVFLAVGAAENLFDGLLQRLRTTSQSQSIVIRPLLASLASLAERLPGREQMGKQLLEELLQNDRSHAIDACSPVSDNMVSQMQSDEGEVSEEIEKLLVSGNSIDPSTMNRLFRNIVPRLEAGWNKMDESRRVFAVLLTRLRIFDTQHFDKLMSDWVSHVRSLKTRPELVELFPLLLSLGCLSVPALLRTANVSAPKVDDGNPEQWANVRGSATYLQELLTLMIMELPKSTALAADEVYRFQIQQQSVISEHPTGLVQLVRNAILEYAGLRKHNSGSSLPLDASAVHDRLLDALRHLVISDAGAVADALSTKSLPIEATNLVYKIVSELLDPEASPDAEMSFDHILSLANERTMPFCQLKLNLELSLAHSKLGEAEGSGPMQFDLFAKAMDRAIEARNIMWTAMLPCFNEDITRSLKGQAYTRFLDLIPSPKSPTFVDDATSNSQVQLAKNLLGVLESIISGQVPQKSAQFTNTLVEKLSDLWDILAAKDGEKAQVQTSVLDHWLPTLLRFITLHSAPPEPMPVPASAATGSIAPKPSSIVSTNFEARARTVLVLFGLLTELESLAMQSTEALAQQVFDIAAILVDTLPEDMRVQCAKSTLVLPGSAPHTTGSSDPRLYYLFSAPQSTPADNLALMFKEKIASPSAAAARTLSAMYGLGPPPAERLAPFALRRWEILSEPTPNVGENDTSLNLRLFEAVKIH
ncbi:hypothetical protein B0I35DRAFT_146295 [Stachybotrys elegans]|uniref:Mediator of RNA polymerase II transcription subunit 12 n=1 Tax=Stachybotrys elegans TaxID=80388 RepID=A0A8K0WK70_9HYPO|nr:hypothetical protein B0I35DRAFT_146295 [Stachybotrys elegans]